MPRRSRPHRLTQLVEAALQRHVRPGDGVLLAVSGGADSTALLEAAAPLRTFRFEVATLDHGLRAEAQEETSAVVAHATRHELAAHVRRLGLPPGAGLEARARTAREAALEAICEERGLRWIATAHTADDQAETVLMRLGRGAGLRGAVGILPRKGRILRPLLGATRAELRRFLEAQGVSWREDPMNTDPAFLRVRVRHQLLPALCAAAGESAPLQLAGFAERAAQDHQTLEALADDARRRLGLADGTLDAVGVRALLPAIRARVLAGLLSEAGVPVDHLRIAGAEEALFQGTHVALRRGITLRAEGGRLRVTREGPSPEAASYTLSPGGRAFDAPSGLVLEVREGGVEGAWSLPVPAEAFPLTVRRRISGEHLVFRDQRRRLQDLLVNARVPRERRDRLPVIVSAGGQGMAVAGLWPSGSEGPEKWRLVAMAQSNPSDRSGTGL